MPVRRRRKFIRRTTSKRRRSFRVSRIRRRIFKSAMSRRPRKTEIKYYNRTVAGTTAGAQSRTTYMVTPEIMAEGAGHHQRVGKCIYFRKVAIRGILKSPVNQLTDEAEPFIPIRIVVWSPRVATSNALNQFSNMGYLQLPDFNTALVFADNYYRLYNPFTYNNATVTGGDSISTGQQGHGIMHYQKIVAFPRRVTFPLGDNQVSEPKDQVHITIFNGAVTSGVSFEFEFRTFFIDP